jgi:putative transcriptional regulator
MADLRAGHLLVATPMLLDPNFAETVVLLLDADENGALGVVLNRPRPCPSPTCLETWADVVAEPEVLFQGGPVSTEGALAVGRLRSPDDARWASARSPTPSA